MSNPKYMDPAHSLIRKFAPQGRLSSGINIVAQITGADRTRVYRWMRPKEKGGTGGLIPSQQQAKLFAYAQEHQLPVSPTDFFETSAAA